MKTELDKCLAGEYYNCHDGIFLEYKKKTRELLIKYNSLFYEQKEEKQDVLKNLFASIGSNVSFFIW